MILIFLAVLGCALIGAGMASGRNRRPAVWFFICFLSGIFGVIALAFMGDAPAEASPASSAVALDLRRWHALVDVDPEIAAAAAEVRQHGTYYENVLAEKYLVLNEKVYLPTLVAKVKEMAANGSQSSAGDDRGNVGAHPYRKRSNGEYIVLDGPHRGKTFGTYGKLEAFLLRA